MSKRTLKFNDIVLNKKDFYALKKGVPLNSVNTSNILVSYRVKHNDPSYKYFIGYHCNDAIRPLYIILPQMSGYIKYFDNDKYIKTKVKTFNNTINTLFSGDEIPKEIIHYVCISAFCIDFILRTDKKNYPQVYLKQCRNKIRKRELVSLIDDEVSLSSDDSDE